MANPSVGIHTIFGQTTGTTISTPTGSTSAVSGSSFLVFVVQNSANTLTVTDTVNGSGTGNTYTQQVIIEETVNLVWLAAYLCKNGAGGLNHIASTTDSQNLNIIELIEIKTASTSAPLDQKNSAIIATTPPINCAVTAAAGELVIGACFSYVISNTITPTGTGYTTLDQWTTTTPVFGSASKANVTAGSTNPAMTYSPNTGQPSAAITLSFQGASGQVSFIRRKGGRHFPGPL